MSQRRRPAGAPRLLPGRSPGYPHGYPAASGPRRLRLPWTGGESPKPARMH